MGVPFETSTAAGWQHPGSFSRSSIAGREPAAARERPKIEACRSTAAPRRAFKRAPLEDSGKIGVRHWRHLKCKQPGPLVLYWYKYYYMYKTI